MFISTHHNKVNLSAVALKQAVEEEAPITDAMANPVQISVKKMSLHLAILN
jgi:hypothetical protein